jgi:hypothetical protein
MVRGMLDPRIIPKEGREEQTPSLSIGVASSAGVAPMVVPSDAVPMVEPESGCVKQNCYSVTLRVLSIATTLFILMQSLMFSPFSPYLHVGGGGVH